MPTMKLSTQAILDRGWTGTMIRALLGEPDEYAPNPRYRSAAPCRLYDIDRITRAEATEAYAQRVAKLEARRRGKDYQSDFRRRYGDATSPAALNDVAEGLFNLNRYAKHDRCSRAHKDEIYGLKNGLVKALFEGGHCTGWNLHEIVKPQKVLSCYCTSYEDDDGFDCDDVGGCARCNYTGIYRTLPELRVRFVAFRFEIIGCAYTWHQPDEMVTWNYSSVPRYEDANDWQPDAEKPLEMSPRKFARAKALIRWVLAGNLAQEAA